MRQKHSRIVSLSLASVLALAVAACGDSGAGTGQGTGAGTGTGAGVATPATGVVAPGAAAPGVTPAATEVQPAQPAQTAQPSAAQPGVAQPGQAGQMGIMGAENVSALASHLLNQEVTTLTGEQAGQIDDLLIDGSTGNVLYARIAHGGFLGIGRNHVVAPLNSIQWDPATNQFILPYDQQAFETFPDVDTGWPANREAGWDEDVATFWQGAGTNLGYDRAQAGTNSIWASNIVNQGLNFGQDAGQADDLIIDLNQGQVTHVLVSAAQGFFADDQVRVLPFQALAPSGAQDGSIAMTATMDPELIRNAPIVDRDALTEAGLFESTWAESADMHWEQAGFPRAMQPGVAQPGVAQPGTAQPGTAQQPGDPMVGQGGVVGGQDLLVLASGLLNTNVVSAVDENLGDIIDLYIDARSGNVLFATIRHGGFLGFGADHIPVPLSALQYDPANEQLLLPITAEQLGTFPAIEQDWAGTVNPGWSQVQGYWNQAGVDTQRIQGVDETNLDSVMLATNLIYYGVGGGTAGAGMGAGTGMARVEDLIINLGTSRIQYALLSLADAAGGFGGTGAVGTGTAAAPGATGALTPTGPVDPVTGAPAAGWIVVPFEAFDPVGFGAQLVLSQDFDLNHLRQAPMIDMNAAVDGGIGVPGAAGVGTTQVVPIDPTWLQQITDYWTQAGYDIGQQQGQQ